MRPASVASSFCAIDGMLFEHGEEVALVDDEQRAIGIADDRGGPRAVVEQ